MKRAPVSRRHVLRGAVAGAAVAIGLPCLDVMLNRSGEAYADGTPLPRRFGLWFFGAGAHPGWTPLTTGDLILPVGLTPLERHRQSVSVISGLDIASFGDYATNRHTMGCSSVLAGAPPLPGVDMRPGAQTIDQTVAKALAAPTPRTSLEVAVAYEDPISFSDATTPNRPIRDPRALFTSLFGGAAPSAADTQQRALRSAYLDAVKDDINSLGRQLGKTDQVRLAQYLDGLNELQKEVSTLPAMVCAGPAQATDGITDKVLSDSNASLQIVNSANSKLLALALACDQTRVFTVNFSTFNSTPWFPVNPGLANNHHELGHQQHVDLPRSVEFVMQRFADFLDALAAIQEGTANVLFNSAILVQTEVARNHEGNNMPTLIAGNAGGALRSGLHVAAKGCTTRASFTVAQAVGAKLPSFGVLEAQTSEAIADVLV